MCIWTLTYMLSIDIIRPNGVYNKIWVNAEGQNEGESPKMSKTVTNVKED